MLPLNQEIKPFSKLDSLVKNLEVLYVLDKVQKLWQNDTPICDEYGREYGSALILKKIFEKRFYHLQTIQFKLKKLRQLKFIEGSGIKYNKKNRKVPISTYNGRSSAPSKGYLVYDVTEKGYKFLSDNLYILLRFEKIKELDKSLNLLLSEK